MLHRKQFRLFYMSFSWILGNLKKCLSLMEAEYFINMVNSTSTDTVLANYK